MNKKKKQQGSHFPYSTHSLEGERIPPTTQPQPQPQSQPQPQPQPQPQTQPQSQPQPQSPLEVPKTVYEEPRKQTPWDRGLQISQKEYQEFLDFKQFKANQQVEIINQQRNKSQENEGFSNINDDFNDVLLFGLLGIFFLIFTDYVYKLGRKSY